LSGNGRGYSLEVMATGGIGKLRGRTTRRRMEKDDKQKELDFAGRESSRNMEKKRVAFKEDEVEVEEEYRLSLMDVSWTRLKEEIKEELKEEMRLELKKERNKYNEWLEECRRKDRDWGLKLKMLEVKIEGLENEVKDMKENMEKMRNSNTTEYALSDTSELGRRDSRESSVAGSRWSMVSEDRVSNLSTREVNKIKNWISDKEKEERKNNIVIKGMKELYRVKDLVKDNKEWVKNFIKRKMNVDCNVVHSRINRNVIIARLGSVEEKREVMVNKYKLKGEEIFIENDLTWEERKVQERISKWSREMRNKGNEVKIGFGKVRVNGVWRYWREIENEIGNDKGERGNRRGVEEVTERNRRETDGRKEQEGEIQEAEGLEEGAIFGEEARK